MTLYELTIDNHPAGVYGASAISALSAGVFLGYCLSRLGWRCV